MSLELRELYRAVIIDHGRNPRHFGDLPQANRQAEGFNPFCGDKIIIYLQVNVKTDTIECMRFNGSGCAISIASASLMAEQLQGKTLQEASTLFQAFHEHIISDPQTEVDESRLGKLITLSGVRAFPSRIKCATLAWHALQNAMNQLNNIAKTE